MGSPHGQQPSHAQWSFYDYHDPDYLLDWKMSEPSKPFRSVMVGQKPNGLFSLLKISWKLFHHKQLVVKLTLYWNLDQSLTFYGSRFCCVAFMFRSEKKFSFGSLGFIDRDTRGSSCISEFLQQQNCLNWSWKSLMLMKGDQRVKQETCRIFVSVKIWGIKATANLTSRFHNIFKLIKHKW